MASNLSPTPPSHGHPAQGDDLLLRETNHRCSNDLQLVVSLLALQSRHAANPEVREALADAMERVSVLAHARRAVHQERPETLELALRQVCAALDAQAEPRSILVSLKPFVHAPFRLEPAERRRLLSGPLPLSHRRRSGANSAKATETIYTHSPHQGELSDSGGVAMRQPERRNASVPPFHWRAVRPTTVAVDVPGQRGPRGPIFWSAPGSAVPE